MSGDVEALARALNRPLAGLIPLEWSVVEGAEFLRDVAAALLASDWMKRHDAEVRAGALREAAAWVADSIGYPVQVAMPEHPMPDALWAALVDHVHADADGRWHGSELSRDEVAGWLAEEASE